MSDVFLVLRNLLCHEKLTGKRYWTPVLSVLLSGKVAAAVLTGGGSDSSGGFPWRTVAFTFCGYRTSSGC